MDTQQGIDKQKHELLTRMFQLGERILDAGGDPNQTVRVLGLFRMRTDLFTTLAGLVSEPSATAATGMKDRARDIRRLLKRVVDQNTQIESVLQQQKDSIKNEVAKYDAALKMNRLYANREILRLLPRGLEVDESL